MKPFNADDVLIVSFNNHPLQSVSPGVSGAAAVGAAVMERQEAASKYIKIPVLPLEPWKGGPFWNMGQLGDIMVVYSNMIECSIMFICHKTYSMLALS